MKKEGIVLIGMAGAGKSTIGALLAAALDFKFIDLDIYILEKEGKTVQEIIEAEGEEALLQLEKRRMYEVGLSRTVVAPGGSIIYHPDLMEYLKQNSTIIYLCVDFISIERRLASILTRGVVGLKNKSLRQVYEERRPLYSRYADFTLNCEGKSYNQLVTEILHLI